MPASVNDFFVIRFAVCAEKASEEDIGERLLGLSFFSIGYLSDIAWDIISEIATDVLRRRDEEKEVKGEDVVRNMEKKSMESIQHKRSFFVRMVSDPKLYNPKIVKNEQRQRMLSMNDDDSNGPM